MYMKNAHLLSRSEHCQLIKLAKEALIKYGVEDHNSLNYTLRFEISKRLKISGGHAKLKNYADGGIRQKSITVTVAYNVYQKYGFESIRGHFMHEMAHAIEYIQKGSSGHTESFKKICVDIGGTMNNSLAGEKYKDNATDDFCHRTIKHHYTCPGCKNTLKRVRRLSRKIITFGVCGRCNTRVSTFIHKSV